MPRSAFVSPRATMSRAGRGRRPRLVLLLLPVALAVALLSRWTEEASFSGARWPWRSARPQRVGCMAAAVQGSGRVLRVLVPIATGSEEIATACITDVLVRAGAEVTVASVEPELQVKMSRGLNIVADKHIDECAGLNDWDVIATLGGMPGAERLADCRPLVDLLKRQQKTGKQIAAICASPAMVLAVNGILEYDEEATCYPSAKFKQLLSGSCAGWSDQPMVMDRKVITSQGPGTSLQFALKIVEITFGDSKARELAEQLLTHRA
mmetsp:Transcript_179286/g.568891  ORF Transcript_179286/g.568891 Transcript_179286/m.568891 type:complete len:266 (+) Transcript_179286:41-838(+)